MSYTRSRILFSVIFFVGIFQRNVPCYRLQYRRERVLAPNVISLKGPLCNLKQGHVLRRFFFENYFSPGTALLGVLLLHFRLTYTNSNPSSKVFILRMPILSQIRTRTSHIFYTSNRGSLCISISKLVCICLKRRIFFDISVVSNLYLIEQISNVAILPTRTTILRLESRKEVEYLLL